MGGGRIAPPRSERHCAVLVQEAGRALTSERRSSQPARGSGEIAPGLPALNPCSGRAPHARPYRFPPRGHVALDSRAQLEIGVRRRLVPLATSHLTPRGPSASPSGCGCRSAGLRRREPAKPFSARRYRRPRECAPPTEPPSGDDPLAVPDAGVAFAGRFGNPRRQSREFLGFPKMLGGCLPPAAILARSTFGIQVEENALLVGFGVNLREQEASIRPARIP